MVGDPCVKGCLFFVLGFFVRGEKGGLVWPMRRVDFVSCFTGVKENNRAPRSLKQIHGAVGVITNEICAHHVHEYIIQDHVCFIILLPCLCCYLISGSFHRACFFLPYVLHPFSLLFSRSFCHFLFILLRDHVVIVEEFFFESMSTGFLWVNECVKGGEGGRV